MGSFLQQCCISNQIIQKGYIIPIIVEKEYRPTQLKTKDGQETMSFPLKQAIYAHEPFKPLGFMFSGEYTDYGQYKIDWNTNLEMFKVFIQYLQKEAFITEQGENEYHEKGFNAELDYDLNSITVDNAQDLFDDLQEKINKGRVFIRWFDRGFELKFATIEQIVGDEIETNGIEYLLKDSFFCNYDGAVERLKATPEQVFNKFKEFLEAREPTFLNEEEEDSEVFEAKLKTYMNSMYEPFKYFLTDTNDVRLTAIHNNLLNDKPFTLETITLLRKLKGIVQGLNIINMGLKPTLYGSQDYSNDTGKMFSKIMSNITTKYKDTYMSEWEDDE